MAKSAAQLNREIAEALVRKKRGIRGVKVYGVEARIVSGIDDKQVWEGTFEVPAINLRDARKKARQLVEESPYHDPRIDPVIALDRVEHIGEVEASLSATLGQASDELITEARKILRKR